MTIKPKYIGYVRVSSFEQAQRNISIPSQIEQIQKYCNDNNIELLKVFKEENSAYKGKRAVFSEMIDFLNKSKDIAGLIVFKWDRISRNINDFNVIDQVATEKKLEIISISEPLLNSYMGRYMIRDIQNRSVLYSEELSFRIKLGIRKKLQNGGDIGGNTPYGYKRVNGTYIKDDERARIVQKIFELYATSMYGNKSLYKKIKSEIPEEYKHELSPRLVEIILNTKTYCGKRVKTWNLSKEEYIFWGVDRPGKHVEEYDLDYVYPIITEKLYNQCEEIKKQKDKRGDFVYSRTGIPKVFQCSCGRLMLRDDKKMNRYLKCPKQINAVFPFKCSEPYANLNKLEPEFEKILLSIIPKKSVLEKTITEIEKEYGKNNKERKLLLIENIKKIDELNKKNDELTQSFIESTISKQILEKSSTLIDSEINKLTSENKLLQNQEEAKRVYGKIIDFVKYLIFVLDMLKSNDKIQKSSQFYNTFFAMIENLKLDNKKVLSYQLKAPFNIIKNTNFAIWWS